MICICKCPGCGDEMIYDMENRVLVCKTCGSEINTDNYDYSYIDYSSGNEIGEGLYESKCPTCGSVVYVNNTEVHVCCSYCQSSLSVFTATNDEILPEKVIPFSLNEAKANIELENWWDIHKTMPRLNKKKLKMTFSPVYVPVWLYDADAYTTMDAEVAPEEASREQITAESITQKLHMGINMNYHKVPFDGSAIIREDRFFGIEPFNYSELKDFNAGYLSGINAERYYYSHEDLIPRLLTRLQKSSIYHCEESIEADKNGGPIKHRDITDLSIVPKGVIYGFVPVWICNYYYHGEKHQIYINGQTGKVDGQVLLANSRYFTEVLSFGITSLLASSIGMLVIATILNSKKLAGTISHLGRLPWQASLFFIVFWGVYIFIIIESFRGKRRENKLKTKSATNIYINENIQLKQGKKTELAFECVMRLALALIGYLLLSSTPVNEIFQASGIGLVIMFQVFALIIAFVDIFVYAKKRKEHLKRRDLVESYQYADMFHFDIFENWLL